jgi:ABC-type amino acid transport substrate-binding protein
LKYKIITAYIFIFLIALSGCSLLDDKTINEHKNLQSAKIGSQTGLTSETFARQNLTEAAMQSFDNLEIILLRP